MAIVNEVSSTLTGAAGLAAAQTIDPAAFDCTGTGDASAFFPLSPTASIVGSVSTNGDEDYYRVSLVAGQVVRLDIDGTNGFPQDLILTGYNPSGVVALTADDNPGGVDPGSNTSFDPFAEFTVNASGFWTFKVAALNGTFGPYTLDITNLSLPIDAYGSAGADLKVGVATPDTIRGYAPGQEAADIGNDTLQGLGGNDWLLGGGGADQLLGGTENDTLEGGAGADSLDGGDGSDSLAGGADGDTLLGGSGQDSLDGGDGNDSLDGGFDADSMAGGLGDDTLLGGNGPGTDSLAGGDGDDSLYGALGADLLLGGSGNDTLVGDPTTNTTGAEADTLKGGDGADLGEGGAGNDSLLGGAGDDTLYGGYILAATPPAGNNTLNGGDGNDSLIGGDSTLLSGGMDGRDLILGGLGNDSIIGGTGADRLFGNEGDDLIYGANSGANIDSYGDLLDGGAGNDTLQGGWLDSLRGGDGDDDIRIRLEVGITQRLSFADGGGGTDRLTLDIADGNIKGVTFDGSRAGVARVEIGSDLAAFPIRTTWYGFESYVVEGSDQPDSFGDMLIGGAGGDSLYSAGGNGDLLDGGAGNDLLSTRALTGPVIGTNVQMLGGTGADTLAFGGSGASGFGDGGAGNDLLLAGDETLTGSAVAVGNVFLDGGAGADTISVQSGDVVAEGGLGSDLLVVTQVTAAALTVTNDGVESWAQSATIALQFTGFERFQLSGNGADDTLQGGMGADTLDGGAGADVLIGGAGTDSLTGGAGADLFRILTPDGADRIADFATGTDAVELSAAGFAGLSAGMDLLATGHLVLGTQARAAVPQVLLDVAGGRIYWDADGTGPTAKVLLATLTGAPALSATDIHVIA